MESSHSFNTKKNIANYVLIPLALVQSEIYWICSVLYYLFKESWATIEEQQRLEDKTRRRANSAPVRSTSAPSPSTHQQQQEPQQQPSVKFADNHTIESYNVDLPTNSLRRSSLPEINIRHRPSIHDERKGTTCPPLWWQRTRVKLGHTPVHGDPKPTMASLMLDSHQKTASVMINNGIQVAVTAVHKTPLPSPISSSASSPISSARPSFEQRSSGSSSSSIESQESNTMKQRDGTNVSNVSNVSNASKKGPKFISKISAAFHKHSRSRD